MSDSEYQLVRLRNGTQAVYVASYDEKMHPGLGPAAEAESVYVRQLRIRERLMHHSEEFVVWDIGLGAGANALTLLKLTAEFPAPLRLVSFDDTSGPLEFALSHRSELGYFEAYEGTVQALLEGGKVQFTEASRPVDWELVRCDFPAWLEAANVVGGVKRCGLPAPHAILFDAFSPAKNPAMWTLPVFQNLFCVLEPGRACNLATYSRSTMLRVTLLRAGFQVGRGIATGLKEETTVAANDPKLLDAPLDEAWLARARRSGCAEPLVEPVYRKAPLSEASWEALRTHRQFAGVSDNDRVWRA